ncbi:oxalocrotonate tautomerase [Penicillium lagena]|uniref:oxalocrotonate tautomerase n=1 Tax=Penicillium lagena TaxID=94218 RepID=UPI002540035B|nr:oxalocrotonate tautomerase [Penicillium lagena]KAJ5624649.1 oxalocrotonate tautomerase [Penicillium lagena]
MPLWQIYHPPNIFTDDATKQSFAKDITKIYTGFGLPAFYVVVQFISIENENVFVGGRTRTSHLDTDKPFVRVVITHIAVHVPEADDAYTRVTSRLDEVMKPHLLDRGYDVEYHVDETERRLWKINGLVPPPHKSAEEQIWVQENRAMPYPLAVPTTSISD